MKLHDWLDWLALTVLIVAIIAVTAPWPKDKPAPTPAPGLTRIETHELQGGALEVMRNRETGEYVYVYEGRQPVIAVMGGTAAK